MLKNVNSQIGQGSQNEIIESLRSEKKEKPKRRFRLIYQQATDHWYFIEMPFGIYWACVKANMRQKKTPDISHLTGINKRNPLTNFL